MKSKNIWAQLHLIEQCNTPGTRQPSPRTAIYVFWIHTTQAACFLTSRPARTLCFYLSGHKNTALWVKTSSKCVQCHLMEKAESVTAHWGVVYRDEETDRPFPIFPSQTFSLSVCLPYTLSPITWKKKMRWCLTKAATREGEYDLQ